MFELYSEDDCLDSNGNMTLKECTIKASNPKGSFSGAFGIIDPDGKVLVPCLFEKEEDMVLAKQYMLAEDKKNLTEVEALRVIARFDPDTNMFKITSVIPDKHWDY